MFTYDLSTDVGQIRMLVPDTDHTTHCFEDDEVQAALTIEGSTQLAAALLLEIMARDRAKIAVRISRGGVSEDLSQVAKELLAQARAIREQQVALGDVPLEAIVTPSWDPFSEETNVLLERSDEVRTP